MRSERSDEERKAKHNPKTKAAAALSLALGVFLGLFSKWLDNLVLEDTVELHRWIERLDLGNFFSDLAIWLLLALVIAILSASALRAALNVFVFFAGMCSAYHLYTILFSGFNPSSYMMIWYGITLLSPLLAALCWYAGGSGASAIALDTGIIAVLPSPAFRWASCISMEEGSCWPSCSARTGGFEPPSEIFKKIPLRQGLLVTLRHELFLAQRR